MPQATVDDQNRGFWSELCGTALADSLGLSEHDPEGLKRFDAEYFRIYPYLKKYVPAEELRGRKCLEIGLGFGTLSQHLAECGADYFGLDIAAEPVEMVRKRFAFAGIGSPDQVHVGSALAMRYADDTFDFLYSIGCLHHTGDLPGSIGEVRRVLKPGGRAIVMVYNKHSLRMLLTKMRQGVKGLFTTRNSRENEARIRGQYDSNAAGDAAPHTDYTSRKEAKELFRGFSDVKIEKQNADPIRLGRGRHVPRERLLKTVGRTLGLDLYIRAVKSAA